MPVLVHDSTSKRVPGYTGYVPGLKYSFGKTFGDYETRVQVQQRLETKKKYDKECLKASLEAEGFTQFPSSNNLERKSQTFPTAAVEKRDRSQSRKPKKESASNEGPENEESVCCQRVPKPPECLPPPRRVQWTDHESDPVDVTPSESIEETGIFNIRNAATQYNNREPPMKEPEEDEETKRHSAATQWSDQEAHRKRMLSAATQWTPIDFSSIKTIPGYAGHLPGRHSVNPGQTFRQEMDSAALANFKLKPNTVTPKSRHTFAAHHQQHYQNDPKGAEEDPYFDNRPPSTYTKGNNPIPGYQGFVPRVRTSASALGVRYIKAVEKSLQSLHDKDNQRALNNENSGNSPSKLLDQRPLHTPRHRPHPHQPPQEEEDWKAVYGRPPSTYQNNSRTYIPGYKGFVPHLRGSPNAVGIRYSKAALRCLEVSQSEQSGRPKTDPSTRARGAEAVEIQRQLSDPEPNAEGDSGDADGPYEEYEDDDIECNNEDDEDVDREGSRTFDEEKKSSYVLGSNRYPSHHQEERPYRQDHAPYFLDDRRPSTYKSDERHPIPGYQGFIPRMRDSPTTLGLRYTKAAVKTLEDVHKMQRR